VKSYNNGIIIILSSACTEVKSFSDLRSLKNLPTSKRTNVVFNPFEKYHEQKTKWESSRRDEHQRYVKPPSILGDVPASRVGLTVSKTSPRMMSDEASLGKYNSNISPLWKTLKLQNKTK